MQSIKTAPLSKKTIESWMEKLIKRANEVGEQGEVPVAAVIIDFNGHCIGHGRNTRNKSFNPLGHAEIIALRQASWIKKDWRFNDCTLIVTLEPCQMCAGAIVQARMGKVIFGANDFKRGGLGGSIDLSTHKSAHHKMIVEKGILENKIKDQIELWFKKKRSKRITT